MRIFRGKSKDEKGLTIPINMLVLYMILAGIKKEEGHKYVGHHGRE